MEYIIFGWVIFAIIALIMLKGFLDERKKKKEFILWLRNHYGDLPKKHDYQEGEMHKISRYSGFMEMKFSMSMILHGMT